MAVRQKSNECQLDQAVQQWFLFGDVMPLDRWFHLSNGFRLTAGHKTTVSNHEGAKEFSKELLVTTGFRANNLTMNLAMSKFKCCTEKGPIKYIYVALPHHVLLSGHFKTVYHVGECTDKLAILYIARKVY